MEIRIPVLAVAVVGIVSIVAVPLSASSQMARAMVEKPKFERLERRDGYEVRRYPACIVAQVTVSGGEEDAMSKGFGTRHLAAAAISRKTAAIAVCVSQSSGTVRVYQNGEEVMHIEPMNRPLVWQAPRLEAVDPDPEDDEKDDD